MTAMKTVQFESGSLIFRQGEDGDFAYVVKTGLVQILKHGPGGASILGEVGPGGLFGEMALIDSAPRMASAITLEPTCCIVVPSGAFEAKVATADPLMRTVIGVLMRNLRSLAERIDDARDGIQEVLPIVEVPLSVPEPPRVAMQLAIETSDAPWRSARLALEALRAMLIHIGEVPLHGDSLFDQLRRAVGNRRLPRIVLETAETLRGLGIDQSLSGSVWDNPELANEEAAHIRQFVMHVAHQLYVTPGLLASLRESRRRKAADAATVSPPILVSRTLEGGYGNRLQ